MTRTKPKSQFSIVLIHELKYLWKLKMLLLNFVILCVCPAIVVNIFKYYTGVVNLYYPVLLTVLMLPRAPVNLIAYSIGGEKSSQNRRMPDFHTPTFTAYVPGQIHGANHHQYINARRFITADPWRGQYYRNLF